MSNGGSGSSPLCACWMGLPSAERLSIASYPRFAPTATAGQTAARYLSTNLRVLFLSLQKISEDSLNRLSLLLLQKFAKQGLAS